MRFRPAQKPHLLPNLAMWLPMNRFSNESLLTRAATTLDGLRRNEADLADSIGATAVRGP